MLTQIVNYPKLSKTILYPFEMPFPLYKLSEIPKICSITVPLWSGYRQQISPASTISSLKDRKAPGNGF